MRKYIVFVVCLVVVVGLGVMALIVYEPKSLRAAPVASGIKGSMEGAPMTTTNAVAQAQSAKAPATPPPKPPPDEQLQGVSNQTVQVVNRKYGAGVYMAQNVQAEPTPEPDKGFYCAVDRYVKCRLVNTVDSSNGSAQTPVDGLVTEDIWFRGYCFIRKGSEVHGWAQVDKSRERIDAACVWVFVLADCYGHLTTQELMVDGQAMDMANDPEFTMMVVGGQKIDSIRNKWGITDASSGLRGVVIKTNDQDAIQLWVAAFMTGISNSVQGTVNNIYGQTAFAGPVAPGAAIASGVVNPAANGVSAVMNQYAQQVMQSIEKDGFFIRVPATKRFYVRLQKGFWSSEARIAASTGIKGAQESFMEQRGQMEKMTEPRQWRDDRNRAPQLPINPIFNQRLDEASASLEESGQRLRKQSDELATQSQAPLPQ